VNPPIKYGMFVIRLKDPLHADGLKKSVTFGDYFRTLLDSYVALKQDKKMKATLKTATSTTNRATISSPLKDRAAVSSPSEEVSSTTSQQHQSRRHLLLTGEEAWLKQWSEPISETEGSTPMPNHHNHGGILGKKEPLHRPLTSKELPQQRKMLTLLGLSPLDEWPPPRCCHPKRSDRRHVCGSVH
jgi:hypothetical protein